MAWRPRWDTEAFLVHLHSYCRWCGDPGARLRGVCRLFSPTSPRHYHLAYDLLSYHATTTWPVTTPWLGVRRLEPTRASPANSTSARPPAAAPRLGSCRLEPSRASLAITTLALASPVHPVLPRAAFCAGLQRCAAHLNCLVPLPSPETVPFLQPPAASSQLSDGPYSPLQPPAAPSQLSDGPYPSLCVFNSSSIVYYPPTFILSPLCFRL